MSNTMYLLLYTTNVVFLVTSVYSWVLKRFYVPDAYKDNFGELFPARRSLASMYILQLTEIIYLVTLRRPEALFYINGTALLVFTSYLVILVRGYFFLEFLSPRQMFLFMHPVFVLWIILLLPVFGIIEYTPLFHTVMTIAVLLTFVGYIYLLDKLRLKVMHVVSEIDENEYSNESDFPVKFAKSVKWLPFVACMFLLVTFLFNSYIAKIIRDIVFCGLNVWFAVYTMNPHRSTKKLPQVLKEKSKTEEIDSNIKYRLSEKYCLEKETMLISLLRDKQLYLEEHLTMNDLIDLMHINKNYLSEVIARSQFQSFYRLVNTMRIEHACKMLKEDPTAKLEQVAIASGFSSGSAFSQVFKRMMDISPKEYISQIHAK